MASSSATAPDEIYSIFLHLRFRMAMSHNLIKKVLHATSAGDPPENSVAARALAKRFDALFSRSRDMRNFFILNFMDPREKVIPLKDFKKGDFDALIEGLEGFRKKMEEIEDAIRTFYRKWTGVTENYAWILYIGARLRIYKDLLKAQSELLQSVEEQEEMERLKSEQVEFEGRLWKFEKGFLQREMRDLGEEMAGKLVKARISGVVGDEEEEEKIGDLEKRLTEFQNALMIDDVDLSSFDENIGEFDKELTEIGNKVFMTNSELDDR